MAMMFEDVGHGGLTYFLRRANDMSLEEARNRLDIELAKNELFSRGWHLAEAIHTEKIKRFPDHRWCRMPRECFIAVTCFTLENPMVGCNLNAWCRSALPTAASWNRFPYKSLWCFLLRAFEMLPPYPTRTLFRGSSSLSATRHDGVLYVQFVSASTSGEVARRYVTPRGIIQVLNYVPHQLMRDISVYSTRENDEDVLIWPFCTFAIFQRSSGVCVLNFSWEYPPRRLPRQLSTWGRWYPRTHIPLVS